MLQQVPPVANFSLPYVDTFDLVANDTTPKYTSDMAGVFTAISVDDVPGKVLQQQTNSAPSCTHGGGGWFGSLIGKAYTDSIAQGHSAHINGCYPQMIRQRLACVNVVDARRWIVDRL